VADWWATSWGLLGADAHQFPDPLDFGRFNPDSALSLGTALEITERHRLTTDDEESPVRLAEPVVKGRDRYSEPLCRFSG